MIVKPNELDHQPIKAPLSLVIVAVADKAFTLPTIGQDLQAVH